MVRVEVERGEVAQVYRDGRGKEWGGEGFCVNIGGATIEFEDEADAVALAVKIFKRMGRGTEEPK